MILIDHIRKVGDTFHYFYFLKGKVYFDEFVGGSDSYIIHIDKLKCSIVISLFEDFRNTINEHLPAEDRLQTVTEARTKISDYIVWALENDHLVDKILKFGLKSVSRAEIIMAEIPETNEIKKELIFYLRCVTFTVNHRITLL